MQSTQSMHATPDAGTVCGASYGVDAGKPKPDAAADARDDTARKEPDAGKGAHPHRDAGDAASDAPVPTCAEKCVTANPMAYAEFERYQVKECGCVADGACYADCHDSTTRAPSSRCGQCLAAETSEGLGSTCTLAAAADCSNDTACSAYQACAGSCPM